MNRNKVLLLIFVIVVIAVALYLFFIPSIDVLSYLNWKNQEGFTSTTYEYAYTNKYDSTRTQEHPYGKKNVLPYGYMDPHVDQNGVDIVPNEDEIHHYRSVFALELMPANGVAPFGYEKSSDGRYIIPTTQDTIYAAIQKSNTALIGGTMVEVPLTIIGHNAVNNRNVMENIERINRDFFSKINISWKIPNNNISNYTLTETYINNNEFQDAQDSKKLVKNPKSAYLIFYALRTIDRDNKRESPIITFDIPTTNYRSPIIFYGYHYKRDDITSDHDRKLIQALCRALGLTSREGNNIMSTDPVNTSKNVTEAQVRIMMEHVEKLTNTRISPESITVNNNNNVSPELQAVLDKVEQKLEDYRDNYYDSIQYHKTEQEIRDNMKQDATDAAYVVDQNGNRVALGKVKTQPDQLYYTAGSYPFGSTNYVPNYEDSVYLSKLTGETMATPLENTAAMKGGFCTQEAHNPLKIDEMCQAMDKNKCASTSCCVLLGGAKCVGGTGNGPTMTGHYSDVTIRDRDYYYYQGKCYGNCPQHNPF
jgi:hypothetical protein